MSWTPENHANYLSDQGTCGQPHEDQSDSFHVMILPYALFSCTLGPQQDQLPSTRTMVHVAPTVAINDYRSEVDMRKDRIRCRSSAFTESGTDAVSHAK